MDEGAPSASIGVVSLNKGEITAKIRAVIRRRRISLQKSREFMGLEPEPFCQILVGSVNAFSAEKLTSLLVRIKGWLDPGTFGGTPAAILSEMGNVALSRRVALYMTAQ